MRHAVCVKRTKEEEDGGTNGTKTKERKIKTRDKKTYTQPCHAYFWSISCFLCTKHTSRTQNHTDNTRARACRTGQHNINTITRTQSSFARSLIRSFLRSFGRLVGPNVVHTSRVCTAIMRITVYLCCSAVHEWWALCGTKWDNTMCHFVFRLILANSCS